MILCHDFSLPFGNCLSPSLGFGSRFGVCIGFCLCIRHRLDAGLCLRQRQRSNRPGAAPLGAVPFGFRPRPPCTAAATTATAAASGCFATATATATLGYHRCVIHCAYHWSSLHGLHCGGRCAREAGTYSAPASATPRATPACRDSIGEPVRVRVGHNFRLTLLALCKSSNANRGSSAGGGVLEGHQTWA